ncbi:hypothetical protein EYF80_064093 [Liparis tanakae]|uniref:Uncharacterized protein n=1 Tax=Liparis tanakae TaxID=230148 RepID=A0A4Z2EAJ2_9TELE|nr:hypothetical protein EYF80_064093 [Liparis tanakae]
MCSGFRVAHLDREAGVWGPAHKEPPLSGGVASDVSASVPARDAAACCL